MHLTNALPTRHTPTLQQILGPCTTYSSHTYITANTWSMHYLLVTHLHHSKHLVHALPTLHTPTSQQTLGPCTTYSSHTYITANTWSMRPLTLLNLHCSSSIARSVPVQILLISKPPYLSITYPSHNN